MPKAIARDRDGFCVVAEGAMTMESVRPAGSLAPLVARICSYGESASRVASRRELPSGCADLIFNLGQDLRIEHPVDVETTFGAGEAFYTGLSATHAVSTTERGQEGAHVELTPLGARLLLGFPLGEIGDALIDPVVLLGPQMREVTSRLIEARSRSERVAILTCFVEDRFSRAAAAPPTDVLWALEQIWNRRGLVRIAALAQEIGCSRKSLTERFSREFGMAPKPFARVMRFARAVRLLRSGRITNGAELSATCGYADQSHLSRDFRAFAGAPPAAFARERSNWTGERQDGSRFAASVTNIQDQA